MDNEVEEMSLDEEAITEDKKEDNQIVDNSEKTEVINQVNEVSKEALNEANVPEKKTNKTLALIILFILLIIDISALVIYLIGIDKVLSFIK